MSLERSRQIEEIFQTALGLDEFAREEFLTENCTDEAMREQVEKLLTTGGAETAEDQELDRMIGREIGAYRLLKEIGRGGMGAVYLAERADAEFEKKVAVKLIKRGMDTDLVVRRFRNERQILATLNHPFITRLIDGGTSREGLPYFVMEYVEGAPLYKYLKKNDLRLTEKLRIFQKICEAVAEAHQYKIIHRDLKPSNILVKADGTPKLLDFGIAKLLDPEIGAVTMEPTATHLRMMTPRYASPEQISGEPISPASDVYSLGVLLYEIVTGQSPYRTKSRSPFEIARAVLEEEPIVPSGAASGKDQQTDAGNLEFGIWNLKPANDGDRIGEDLELIILKSLRKNPSERYASAAELAADVKNYLENRPVAAEHFAEKAKKTSVAAANQKTLAVLPFTLIGGAAADSADNYLSIGLVDAMITRLSKVQRLVVRPTSAVLRFDETTDALAAAGELGVEFVASGTIRRIGERIRATAQLLNVSENSTVWSESFDENFTDVLELEDSLSERVAQSLIPKLTGEEARRLQKRGTNSPEAYEEFLKGRFYWNLQTEEGYARAIRYYQKAVELDPNYAEVYAAIAEYYIFIGIHCVIPFAEGSLAAKEAAEKAVALDPTSAEGYAALGFAAISFELNWEKAEKLFIKAVELNPNSITANFWYVAVLAQSKRFEAALKQVEKVSELDPHSLLATHMRAWVLYHARDFDESLEIHEEMLRAEPNYPWGLQTYSWVLRRAGRFDEAVAQAEKAVRLTGENPFYLAALASAYAEAGEREKAFEILRRLDEIERTRFVSEYMLALVYCALGDKEKAFENLEKSLAARDGWTNWFGTEPQFDILRSDPRFEDLLRRSGNVTAKFGKEKTEKSIAVLPFKLIGAGENTGEEEYLGVGLADALTTRLSNVRRLSVRPTSSVLAFERATIDAFAAGRQLDVDFVLDGSIRRAGSRIRVTVQLLSVAENASRWAETFDERFTDVLELEDTISAAVAESLIPKLTGEERRRLEKRGTNSADAYEFYMRGRFHWNQFTPDAMFKAQSAFEKAIEIDPNYALAHVGLCDSYIWANIYGLIPAAEALRLAEKAALRAIELDDKLGEAYASLGLTHQNRHSWEKAERLYLKALELSPNYVHAHEWWAAQLVGHGRFEEGVREIRIAERLDPLSLRTKILTAWTLYQARHFEAALAVGRQVVDLDESYPQGYAQIANNQLQLGQIEEAIANFRKFDRMIPNSALAKYVLCHALVAGGREREARRILEEIKTLAAEGYVKPFFLGMAFAALDERDAAFENFEKAFAENDPWMLWFGTEPLLDRVRDDARFDDLLRRMRLPILKRARVEK
jgi:eukaryotic-like serine/threonine-protein kinase